LEKPANKVLIVEDHPLIGKSIVDAINNFSSVKSLQLTTSLHEAISLLGVNDFNLIILDLSLPDGNGLELLKLLKERKEKKKVLVFSTNTDLKNVCLRYGAYAFFDKANDFDELIETIKNKNIF
jgi:DNA-binding NarL/FixJ family response regulator